LQEKVTETVATRQGSSVLDFWVLLGAIPLSRHRGN